jgi:hypothetical protein
MAAADNQQFGNSEEGEGTDGDELGFPQRQGKGCDDFPQLEYDVQSDDG